MKNLFLTAMAILTFSFANAQDNAVKVNPVGIAFGIANAGYEFSVNEGQSLTVSALYYDRDNLSGFGGGAEYRFYFAGEALRGWHAGPNAGYFSLEDDFNNSGSVFSIGGEVGHQWIFGEHFLLDLNIGLGFNVGESDSLNVESTNVGLGLAIGYAW